MHLVTVLQILVCSLRNSNAAQISLFARANCRVVISCSSLNQKLQGFFAASGHIRKVQAPELEHVLNEELVPHYSYNETFETASDDPIIHLHTSGSSGNPTPISWNKSFLCSIDTANIIPEDQLTQGPSLTRVFLENQSTLPLLPSFHAGGLGFSMFPAFFDMTLVLGHPDVPFTAQYVSQLLGTGVVTSLLTPPSILADLCKDPIGLENLAKVSHIGYGGGPLQPEVGDLLSTIVPHIFSHIGATETGWFHTAAGDNTKWDCLRYYSDIGYRFDEISEGIFELVIVNEPTTTKYHAIFSVYPELEEYRMKDLYTRHPSSPGWWRYQGRSDDLIVLSNGEKINPIAMENIIGSAPGVLSALVVGEQRFNPSLLVEMAPDKHPKTDEERLELLNQIWPYIQEANKVAPGFAKVPKSLLLFSSPEKPFPRAGKGTVIRKKAVEAYDEELERLYSSQEASLLIENLSLRKPAMPGDIKTLVREIYAQSLEGTWLNDSDDVFQHGLDSLRVAIVVARLQAALGYCEVPVFATDITQRLVYSAPSIDKTTDAILKLSVVPNSTSHAKGVELTKRREKRQSLLAKYSTGMISTAWNIVLTGTTGSLGSHLLATLEQMPESKVKRIFCLNRSAKGKARQEKSSMARGLKSTWDDKRIHFMQADLSKADLGLGSETYTGLLHDATIIIHSAWPVDFNLSIDSFEPHIKGVRNLLDFSAKSAKRAPLVFISSISTVLGYLDKYPGSVAPEAIIDDDDAPEPIGYGESKFISELLIEKCAKASGVNAAIFRTGQIAGSLSGKGMWNKQEWFPSMMISSKHLGVLPSDLGIMDVVDWIPADLLASIMVELTGNILHQSSKDEGTTTVYNLVNPQVTTWSALCPQVQQLAGIPRTVPLREWVHFLEESGKSRNAIDNPALKLLDFFRTLSAKGPPVDTRSRFEVKGLVRDSRRAADLKMVTPEWINFWMNGWG